MKEHDVRQEQEREMKPASPLPWRVSECDVDAVVGADGVRLMQCSSYRRGGPQNARYIVEACNAYPALVAAREQLTASLRDMRDEMDGAVKESLLAAGAVTETALLVKGWIATLDQHLKDTP
jgi:hypothetical protein